MCNPTTGSPTITLFQLRSNYHTGLDPQSKHSLDNKYPTSNVTKGRFVAYYFKLLNFQTMQLFERDGRCVQSLIYHSP